TASRQNCSPRGIANTTTDHFGTGDSRALRTPFALRSRNFRPTFSPAPFLKSTARDTTADRFVACTRALTIPSPAMRQSKSYADPYAQESCLHLPSHSCKQGPSQARGAIMTEKTIDLDQHRGMAAQKATELRRLLANVEANEKVLRLRQDELEARLIAAPATNWREAAEKARYLLKFFASSPSAQDPRRQKLIAAVINDFERLARK